MGSLQEEVVTLKVRADFLLNVVTQISRNNNDSWTLAIGLLDDVEVAKVSEERESPQCGQTGQDQADQDQDQGQEQTDLVQEQQPSLDFYQAAP